MLCPNCGNELDEDNYCYNCMKYFNDSADYLRYDRENEFDYKDI